MAPVRHRWSINDVIGGIRNTVMSSDCSLLKQAVTDTIEIIDLKFMVSGHSFLPKDSDFGSIEVFAKAKLFTYQSIEQLLDKEIVEIEKSKGDNWEEKFKGSYFVSVTHVEIILYLLYKRYFTYCKFNLHFCPIRKGYLVDWIDESKIVFDKIKEFDYLTFALQTLMPVLSSHLLALHRSRTSVPFPFRSVISRSMTFVSRKKSILSRLRTSHNLRDIAQDFETPFFNFLRYGFLNHMTPLIVVFDECTIYSNMDKRNVVFRTKENLYRIYIRVGWNTIYQMLCWGAGIAANYVNRPYFLKVANSLKITRVNLMRMQPLMTQLMKITGVNLIRMQPLMTNSLKITGVNLMRMQPLMTDALKFTDVNLMRMQPLMTN
ncbi:hypothetical protein ANN_20637 [Periplaneta americana]|uniref:Uncharacterized protein n=1 Tax=Periplaneta americana TaxID=6978 RepID=A0ABQ8SDL7_PERAM|nr:hypothetical protein ANN_20637 [Periplaneta americana]